MKRLPKFLRTGCIAIIVLCLVASGVSALSNQFLPRSSQLPDRLEPVDKARLAEALRLKSKLGETVWPGWGKMGTPVILSNGEQSFLFGFTSAPPGWTPVEGDDFQEQPYYRQETRDHQNFAVEVGGQWAASMATKQYTDAFLVESLKNEFPPVIDQIFPYRILLQPSETQITGVLHESLHVFQVTQAPELLNAAEAAHKLEGDYAEYEEAMQEAWKDEAKTLENALKAETNTERVRLVRDVLSLRAERRADASLPAELVEYERWLEWEEGLAKYIELAMWKAAYETGISSPDPALQADRDFKEYQTFPSRWKQNLIEINTVSGQGGESRFYYTGMAQAFLLDQLSPAWKARAFDPGVWLEDLLAEAVQ